ncbi:MAG: hypothetical protein ABI707_03660 [Ferruginibacter sp.]
MKQLFFLIVIFCLTQFSCKKEDSADSTPTSLNGKWRMITVKEIASGATITKPLSIPGDVDVTIISTSPGNGTFMGNTPTNEILQNNYSTGENRTITIPNLNMTKVMETTWGNEFADNIRSSQNYSFETGGRLNIKTTNKILTFQKQ